MNNDEKIAAVMAAAGQSEGRPVITCAAAFRLSGQSGISVKEIGEICQRNGIKITGCQLGCFR